MDIYAGGVALQWDTVSFGEAYSETWEVILAQTMASCVANLITTILVYGDRYLFYALCTVSLLHVENQIPFVEKNTVKK